MTLIPRFQKQKGEKIASDISKQLTTEKEKKRKKDIHKGIYCFQTTINILCVLLQRLNAHVQGCDYKTAKKLKYFFPSLSTEKLRIGDKNFLKKIRNVWAL